MSIWDKITVTLPGSDDAYEEGVDYVVDYENDTISRIEGGSIPDGAEVRVHYGKGVDGGVVEDLIEGGSAILRPVCSLVKILPSHDSDLFEEGVDISGSVVRLELIQSISAEPDTLQIVIADHSVYTGCNPDDDVIIGAAIGEVDIEGVTHFLEVFRGLVHSREFVSSGDGAHHVRITVKDFSISLDAPRQGALGLTWHPRLRREVFRNGAIIADDYRAIRSATLCDSVDFDDVVELQFAKEYPRAHDIIRDCFAMAKSDFLADLVIDCLDFPVVYLDGREKTPGDVIRGIASLAGASVKAEGTTLIISENGFPGGFKTVWVYDAITVLDESESMQDENRFTAVQIFGRSETSRLPTKSIYLPPTDFTQPGWYRVVDEEGTLEPSKPYRTDSIPQPAELNFQIDGELYEPSSIRVIGGELAYAPKVDVVNGKKVINVTVLMDWKIEDKAGECPWIEDENGGRLFRIQGKIYDAVPTGDGEYLPIPYAGVRRERLDGGNPGETFDISADSDGCYIFEAVPLGTYKIIASATGYLDNYSDDDPGNDELRDLHIEEYKYESEIDEGRYEKQATDYHVIVWARPRTLMGPLADLTVSQVLLEVRAKSAQTGETPVYGPAVRDERITTEVMAKRVGQILLAGASQGAPSITLRLPMNRWLSAGDGIRVIGNALDLAIPGGRAFQATMVKKIFEPEKGAAYDIVTSAPEKISAKFAGKISDDPLDTRVGVIVAVYRNEIGGRVYDVAAAGRVMYGLRSHPVLGELGVGETVQVSKASQSALSYIIVARTTEVFGEERICYV